jgi:endonuclease G, mitochondrial
MKKLLIALSLLFVPAAAFASPCDQFYPNGKEVVVPNTVVLCNSFFVTVYDDVNNATVFSSEIAQERVKKVPRTNDFRADKRIKDSPTPDDYTNTGYDRGHMAAAANADDTIEMSESFLMTNMTPQLPSVNRVAWRMLEDRVRSIPFKWVVTGAYYGATPKCGATTKCIGKSQVPVPQFLYKVVFFESGKTAVYIIDNVTPKSQVSTMSLEELEKLIGYKLQ